MKSFFALFLLFLFISGGCRNTEKDTSKKSGFSKIEFESTTYDFGTIAFKSDGSCVFSFKNTSETPLLINKVSTSCGCTNPDWPKNPIETGKSGEIKVAYNTQIPGTFHKSITVFCNAENSPVKLFIKGEVLPETIKESSSSNQ